MKRGKRKIEKEGRKKNRQRPQDPFTKLVNLVT